MTLSGDARIKRKMFLQLHIPPDYKCIECYRPMKKKNHYVKFLQCCPHCRYSTRCSLAFDSHLLQHSSKNLVHTNCGLYRKQEVLSVATIQCSCGFETRFGNKYCRHVGHCWLSNQSIVKLFRNSKASSSNILPHKILESLGLVRKFDRGRLKSHNVFSSRSLQPKKLHKRKIVQEANSPLDDFSRYCSKLKQYSLILAQKVASASSNFETNELFRHGMNSKTLFSALASSNRASYQFNSKSSSTLPEELSFSCEQWRKALSEIPIEDIFLKCSNLPGGRSEKFNGTINYDYVNYDCVRCSQSIVL